MPYTLRMKLNEKLRAERTKRNLRLKDVSSAAGISIPFLSDIERGRTNPSLITLDSIAKVYGMTMREILSGTDLASASDYSPVKDTDETFIIEIPGNYGTWLPVGKKIKGRRKALEEYALLLDTYPKIRITSK